MTGSLHGDTEPTGAEGSRASAEPTGDGFHQLFRRWQGPVYTFFADRGLSKQDAQDLTQETFVQAYQSLGRFQGASKLSTWLFSVARNVLRNHYRDRSRLKRKAPELSLETLREERRLGEHEADSGSGPLETILAEETRRRLCQAVLALPEEMKDCVLLHYDQGLKYREIAAVRRLPVGRVKSRLFEARKKLEAMLADPGAPKGYEPLERSP